MYGVPMPILLRFLKRSISLLISTTLAVWLASSFSTAIVLINLQQSGAKINMNEGLSMWLYDSQHFAPLYGLFVLVAFLCAFLAAAIVFKRVKTNRTLLYIIAGATAIIVMLYAMKSVFFGVPIVAGARTYFGLFLQALAGGIGGYIYARLTARFLDFS